ncbi:DUF4365 domain-containing protein [Thalassolituus pacificus]|uniref:DUF4365 domain-containing protein n=1 Tax=Thalassolituus pacificus TaxID=2975440 RepID=A0A9X2WIH3_9GAMM|nr:DUF4365 domain-containing protein [Thalassolituus pacificus]MCT7361042.1 DUF4365 domain-containing protein [Thalassolituus pacificus]
MFIQCEDNKCLFILMVSNIWGEMDVSKRKELFSVAYLTALAAQVGLNHQVPTVDDDSIDLSLMGKGYNGIVRSPQIDIQLKCTSKEVIEGDCLKFDLKLKNYNDLRGENVGNTRYLMVLVVPDEPEEWATIGYDNVTLQNSFYWTSLRFNSETSNITKVRIEIPVSQKVTSETLLSLMDMASKGEFV